MMRGRENLDTLPPSTVAEKVECVRLDYGGTLLSAVPTVAWAGLPFSGLETSGESFLS